MDSITNKHKGNRFIIGGTSPNLKKLDPKLLKTGIVIGVNQFANHYKPNYWLTCDPHNIEKRMNGVLTQLDGVTKFIHKHPQYNIYNAEYLFERPEGTKLDSFRQPVDENYPVPLR